jgi:hypothetical protein
MAASDLSSGIRHGAHAAPRSGSWPRGRVLAVGLTVLAVGVGTWVLGASEDKPAPHTGRADVHSLPAGSAPPLAVAPPPSRHGTTAAAGSVRRARSVAVGAR